MKALKKISWIIDQWREVAHIFIQHKFPDPMSPRKNIGFSNSISLSQVIRYSSRSVFNVDVPMVKGQREELKKANKLDLQGPPLSKSDYSTKNDVVSLTNLLALCASNVKICLQGPSGPLLQIYLESGKTR